MNEKTPVIELYKCIQGEGQLAGTLHILIRTSGCRLRCQFENSICDTSYASWQPEKYKYTIDDLSLFYIKNRDIHFTMITGGGPTLHPEFLKELCKWIKSFDNDHCITLETEGSEFVEADYDIVSLSPKLRSSIPRPGTWDNILKRTVTEKDKEQHERWRCNYDEMSKFIEYCRRNNKSFQIKPVICSNTFLEDIKEVEYIIEKINVGKNSVYLMPEGITDEQLQHTRGILMQYCIDNGYNYTDRLHILAFGNKRGV